MTRDYHRWYSRSLGRDMELLVFGHGGPPVVVFPSSMGAFFEFEDRGMVEALRRQTRQRLAAALLRVVGRRRELVRARQAATRASGSNVICSTSPTSSATSCRSSASSIRSRGIGVTGCSFGAYHAMAMALRHPYVFTSCITMSGAFDIRQFLDGWSDTRRLPAQPGRRSCRTWATPTT